MKRSRVKQLAVVVTATLAVAMMAVISSSSSHEQDDPTAKGVGRAPGSTSRAPIHRAVNGNPHALTWNIGTIGMTVSASPSPQVSRSPSIMLCSSRAR